MPDLAILVELADFYDADIREIPDGAGKSGIMEKEGKETFKIRGETVMIFKTGQGWKACYDEENGRYFGEYGGTQSYSLYEITKEQYDRIDETMTEYDAAMIMYDGRQLYYAVDDRCGPPYTIVFDDAYETLCPWAKVMKAGRTWPDELTDAAVEVFASQENNREQRRRKRQEREKKDN